MNPWIKTRKDHSRESAEDYVELIFRLEGESQSERVRLVDLAVRFGVSAPTVSKLLSRLETEGLVRVQPRSHVELTEEGRQMAKRSLERHQIVLSFLQKIGVSAAQAELDTEGIEHHVSTETLQAMKDFLEN